MLNVFSKIFGTRNDREVKQYRKKVQEITALESQYENLSDEELQSEFNKLKELVQKEEKSLNDVLMQSFAITREASKRVLNMRPYDVQLIGAMVLHEGRIAEMKTGEGKTLVGSLSVALNALSGNGVHVVTVNDYLASRDANELRPLYNFLGFSVGAVVGGLRNDAERREQYSCDITYGTNNEFGFDYLRDNMNYDINEKVQRGHNFVIVDEVDSILIDEARTPLIISGPTNHKNSNYVRANEIALKLERGQLIEPKSASDKPTTTGDFIVDEKNGKLRPEIDHFYPKAKYPHLSLSFYNLIPSCSTCNSKFKGNATHEGNILHPYYEDFNKKAKFSVSVDSMPADKNIELEVNLNVCDKTDEKCKKSIERFQLDKIYKQHNDIAKEIWNKAQVYNESRIDELYESFYKGLDYSKEDVKNMVFCNYLHKDDIHKRNHTKLTQDILKQFDIIKNIAK